MSAWTEARCPILLGPLGLLWIGFLAFPGTARASTADIPPDEVAAAIQETGLSPTELAALRAQGLSEERIQELLAQRAGAAVPPEGVSSEGEPVAAAEERVEEAPEEIIEEEQPEDEDELVPFGYSLFENSPDSYRQPAYGPVDPDYPLGPGDEVVLDVWGDTVFRLERKLDREGGINLPDVGRVVLAGQTLESARQTLRKQLARVYSGLRDGGTTHLSVTLGNLRVVRVFVVGRARRPGGYDLSAASTVFHALFFAGGPTEKGSLRDIRVVRGGQEIATLDVYEYLRHGRREGDVRLENDDTVFIPPVGPRVAVQGQIREPGIYEMLPGETVEDLIATSGGLTERAYPGRVQIERILTRDELASGKEDRKIEDYRFDEGEAPVLRDGDVVTVFEMTDRLRNFVIVRGEVRRPGRYELSEASRLSDVIERAGGLLETAFLDRAEVVRTYEDERREQVSVDLARVLAGDPERDVLIRPRDEITVHSIWALRDSSEVSIFGAVRDPGAYDMRENMTLRDLMLRAGGALDHAYLEEVEVSRVNPDEGGLTTAEIFKVPLGENYLSKNGQDFRLQAWDNIFVRMTPNYELQRNVKITGEVRFPGVYTLRSPVERLTDVVERAGGLKETAYPEGFSLVREKDEIGRLALDLTKALKNPNAHDNVILFAGDSLYIPEEPKTVTVRGEVGYPTSLLYSPGLSISDYVDRAGGTTEKADKKHIRIVYSTGAAARVKRLWFDPEVRPGSTIVVPAKEEGAGVNWGSIARDTTSILASLATVALVINQVNK